MVELIWSLPRRVAFRWAVILFALLMFPFPLTAIPKFDDVASLLRAPIQGSVVWFAQAVLDLPAPDFAFNGSGDRLYDYVELLLFAIVAAVGTIAWSIVDHRRKAYPRLAAGAHVALRYYVAHAMLTYGWIKITKSQFPDPRPGWLYQQLGDSSPMRLLWAFMGYSAPYTIFAGLSEAAAAVLLLWRRTAVLGALLAAAVMTNVVMLNFCYDVPVKLYSMRLLIMAAIIALPAARRVLAALIGHAVAEVPSRARMSPRIERTRSVAKLVIVVVMVADVLLITRRPRHEARGELYGTWIVDSFLVDGIEQPATASDPPRWQAWTAHVPYTTIWLLSGRRERRQPGDDGWFPLAVDEAKRTITLTLDEKRKIVEIWTYTRPAPDRLVIDCMRGAKRLHITLHRDPDGLLMTRGFRWINDEPYNI